MPEIRLAYFECPKCHKKYEDSERGHFPGKPCRECGERIVKTIALERRLLAEEFSIEKEDEQVAKQINEVLVRESSGVAEKDEQLLNDLIERLIKDEKRRKKLLKEIRSLQKEKR
jgi:NAD-dependent SIR2 family protein deacetylase